jgi:ribosomal protein L12E/L44/L45/RPP1/RPP2
MKLHAIAALAIIAAPLAACGGRGDDTLGDNVETVAENKSDALESVGNEAGADAVEEKAEATSEAIDDADVNTEMMSEGQKAAVANGTATVQ